MQQILAQGSANVLVDAANTIGTEALRLSTTVNPILANANSTVASLFAPLKTNTANQLSQVAKLIEARAATGALRQIFFVQLGSFDTHGDQINRQQNLFAELSPALKAFYDATSALGVGSQVTTFTLSDFGRTLQPASGGGTDHAWGNHHSSSAMQFMAVRSLTSIRNWCLAAPAMPKAKVAGYPRPRSINMAQCWQNGSVSRRPTWPSPFPISRISRPRTWVSSADAPSPAQAVSSRFGSLDQNLK